MSRVRRALALAALAAVALGACARAPKDPVERLLAALETAVEERDADAFAARLLPEARGRGMPDRAGLLVELRRVFVLYESIEVERAPFEVAREGAETLVRLRVLASAKPKLEGRFGLVASESSPLSVELRCREQGGELLVLTIDWKEEAPRAP